MRNATVIIVEKDSAIRNQLMCAFEERGYWTWTSPSPEMAFSIFSYVEPTVILLDLDGQEPEALELLAGCKKNSPQTLLIVEAGDTDAAQMKAAMDYGADAFLVRSFSLAPLFDILEKDIPPAPHLAPLRLQRHGSA